MNIDVITVQYFGTASTMQTMPGASSTPLPGGAVRRISPGMRPRSQTDRARGPCPLDKREGQDVRDDDGDGDDCGALGGILIFVRKHEAESRVPPLGV